MQRGLRPGCFLGSQVEWLNERMDWLGISWLSIFQDGQWLFLYYECSGKEAQPEQLFPPAVEMLKVWPGGDYPRLWVPMMDIFHYQQPVSGQHWKRNQTPGLPTAGWQYSSRSRSQAMSITIINIRRSARETVTNTGSSVFMRTCCSFIPSCPQPWSPLPIRGNSQRICVRSSGERLWSRILSSGRM